MDETTNNDQGVNLTDINTNPQKDADTSLPKSSIEMDVPFSPFDHTTTQVPSDNSLSAFGYNPAEPPKESIGFEEGAVANWEDKNDTWKLAHGGWDRSEDYIDAYKDPNFNPLQFQDKFINIAPQYQSYLLASENEKQMDFRLKRIYHEQSIDNSVKNSSWMQWLTGGGAGLATDLINYIPVIGQVKYAKWGKTAVSSFARSMPGGAAYGFGSSLGDQVDKINGNMHDFLTDGLIRSVFATTLFGANPLLGLAADTLQLWNLQSYVGDAVRGIGYKLKVGEKGEVQGLHAYDMTTDGSLSADKVKLAQDKADSAFYKNGLFKVPYIGTAAEKLMSNSFFGSAALSMILSPYQTVRSVIDLAYDHGITTKGLAEGKAKPITFFTQMQKTIAHIRQEQNIFNALHMERNGVKSDNYIAQSAIKAGMYTKQKTLEKISSEIGDRPYISQEKFSDEVQQVMYSGNPHENAAVNDAAAMFKKSMDSYYKNFRTAFNLPEDWLPPITAKQYLMRVYDTNFMNNNQGLWTDVISSELRNQDNKIIEYSQPINTLSKQIKDFESAHTEAVRELGKSEELEQEFNPQVTIPHITNEVGPGIKTYHIPEQTRIGTDQTKVALSQPAMQLREMKAKLKALKESLQNEIRSNPKMHLLADDWHALSANEANELKVLLKPINDLKKSVEDQRTIISDLKEQKSRQLASAKNKKTAEKATPKAKEFVVSEEQLIKEQKKLDDLQYDLSEAEINLNMRAHKGEINQRFYKTNGTVINFKNPNDRLKFRKTYHEQKGFTVEEVEAHDLRREHATAYYHTIMNQTAEDTINQIMGKYTGNGFENHIKARTLMIPDDILYKYNFMTKDLLSKVANYKMWLARRTHLKNTYKNISIDGGFEPLIKEMSDDFNARHESLNNDKAKFEAKLKEENLSDDKRKQAQKGLNQTEKAIKKNSKDFNRGKMQVQFAYEKMAGISKLDARAKSIVSGIKSFNVFANLGFLPATMITDLSANGLKQGLIPFIQNGLYPTIQSLGGLLKTHDSQSLRDTAGALNLGLHHVGNTTASRQIDLSTNPYINAGKIPAALDKIAHFTSNINLTTTIDNYLQRVTSAVAQSNVIRHMIAFSEGKLSKADRMWLNRYGLNPEKDSEAIIKAFKQDGGGTNKLGGYQSNFWHWQDLESANKVADAVFRSTHDTIISANAFDSPIWLDENSMLGMMAPIIRGFKGWAFASLNRYLIPSLQQPDAQKLMGFALMSASAALVSPSRRMARGESPYREGQTPAQIVAEILLDSPQLAWISEALQDANLLTHGTLLSDLKNDKYYDRTLMGILGPTGSNANKLTNFVTAMATGNMNQQDVMGMASMIPVANSLYGYQATKNLTDAFGLPKHR